MIDKPPIRFSIVGFLFLIGLGFGLAYGVARAAHLGLVSGGICIAVILLIQWFIWRNGKSASYANAQAWASAQVDVAVQVYQEATAIAQAKAESLSVATALAQASVSNQFVVQMAQLTPELLYKAISELGSDKVAEGLQAAAEPALEPSRAKPDYFIG